MYKATERRPTRHAFGAPARPTYMLFARFRHFSHKYDRRSLLLMILSLPSGATWCRNEGHNVVASSIAYVDTEHGVQTHARLDTWVKPGVWGAVISAVALMIGFAW